MKAHTPLVHCKNNKFTGAENINIRLQGPSTPLSSYASATTRLDCSFFSNLKSLNMLWITWHRYFAGHFEIGFDGLVCEDSEDCTLISACCPSLCMHAYGETRSQHVFTSYGPVSSITPNYVIFYSWTWGPDRKALLVVIKKELAEINGIFSWKKSWRFADT